MERNDNHIIPSYCYLPVGCRSLGDRYGSLGSYKPQNLFFIYLLTIYVRKTDWLFDEANHRLAGRLFLGSLSPKYFNDKIQAQLQTNDGCSGVSAHVHTAHMQKDDQNRKY